MPIDPDPDPSTLIFLLLSLCCILLAAAYSAVASVLSRLSASQIKRDAENGDASARRLRQSMDLEIGGVHTPRHQAVIWAVLGACAWDAALLAVLTGLLPGEGWLQGALCWLLSSLLYALLIGVLGFLLPRKAVLIHPRQWAARHAGMIWGLTRLGSFSLGLHSAIVTGILRLFKVDARVLDESVTEEEILQVLDEAEEQDTIEENEKDMIANILEFNDTTAEETMTHRTDIVSVPEDASILKAVELAVENGVSRIPVYHEDIDSVVGICYVKDLLPYVGQQIPAGLDVAGLMRQAYFVPESKKCSQLFREMTERKVQIAIVVDEYGGTAGLVTLEDLVESIVGNIQDEYDREDDEEPRRLSERAYTVSGSLPIDEATDLLGVELPEGDYDTIAGLVTDRLGYLPKETDHPKITVNGLSITVLAVEEQRLARLLLVKEQPAAEKEREKK